MSAYILRRLVLIIPTLFAIMVLNFTIIQIAPGGPVEQMIARLQGTAIDATAQISGGASGEIAKPKDVKASTGDSESSYRGARGLDRLELAHEALLLRDRQRGVRLELRLTHATLHQLLQQRRHLLGVTR